MTTRLATHQMVNQGTFVLVTQYEQHKAVVYSNTYENSYMLASVVLLCLFNATRVLLYLRLEQVAVAQQAVGIGLMLLNDIPIWQTVSHSCPCECVT